LKANFALAAPGAQGKKAAAYILTALLVGVLIVIALSGHASLGWRLALAILVAAVVASYAMPTFGKYLRKRIYWYTGTFFVALALNFLLPRLIPGNPVDIILQDVLAGITDSSAATALKNQYIAQLGLDKSILEQFFRYTGNLFKGELGMSLYLAQPVAKILASKIPWSVAIMLPSILVGWLAGNLLGAYAAYKKGIYEKVIFPVSLFLSSIPSFIFSMLMLLWLGVSWGWFPVLGGFDAQIISKQSGVYYMSLLSHWALPFISQTLIVIGGQAIGMRSMALYELNVDYVLFAKLQGIRDRKVTRYVFRNAMLPQVSGLALSLGGMVAGSTLIEIVFSYPGLGQQLMMAIRNVDYPLISGCTLVISITMLVANLLIDIIYGLIDPRVRTAQAEEG
jgi:peptide/nickel transport system permease protein